MNLRYFPNIEVLSLYKGAFSAFAMLAKRPEYNAKIKAFASLGSARSLCHSSFKFLVKKLTAIGVS